MEFNPDRVRKISSEILIALERLEELRRLPKERFLSDPHMIGSAKYNFIVAIEGIIDLCNHVIAKNGFRTPEDYADTLHPVEKSEQLHFVSQQESGQIVKTVANE